MQFSSLASALVCAALLAACAAEDATPVEPGQATPTAQAAGTDPPAPGAAGQPAPPDPAGGTQQEGPDTGAADYIATGNEPFWSVRITGGTLVYTTPENLEGQVLQATREESGGVVRYSGEADGQPFVLELHEEPCQDTMSGWMHDFRSGFTWGRRALAGCARRGSDPVGELPPRP